MKIFLCALAAGALCGCAASPEIRAMAARVEVSAGVTKAGDYYYGPLKARIRGEDEVAEMAAAEAGWK